MSGKTWAFWPKTKRVSNFLILPLCVSFSFCQRTIPPSEPISFANAQVIEFPKIDRSIHKSPWKTWLANLKLDLFSDFRGNLTPKDPSSKIPNISFSRSSKNRFQVMELEQWLSAQQKQDTGISLWIHTQDHLGLEKLFSQLSKSKKSLIGFTPGFFDFLERIDASASLASSVNTSASSSDEIFLKFSETRLESPFSNLCNYLEGWINSEVLLKSLSPFKGQKVLQAKCIVKLGSAPDTMNSLLLAQLPLPLFDTERLNIPFRKEEDLYSRKLWEKLSQ